VRVHVGLHGLGVGLDRVRRIVAGSARRRETQLPIHKEGCISSAAAAAASWSIIAIIIIIINDNTHHHPHALPPHHHHPVRLTSLTGSAEKSSSRVAPHSSSSRAGSCLYASDACAKGAQTPLRSGTSSIRGPPQPLRSPICEGVWTPHPKVDLRAVWRPKVNDGRTVSPSMYTNANALMRLLTGRACHSHLHDGVEGVRPEGRDDLDIAKRLEVAAIN
jgi:hypothetical protein